jgi:hypothetical protein
VGLGAGAAADGIIVRSFLERTDTNKRSLKAGALKSAQLADWEASADVTGAIAGGGGGGSGGINQRPSLSLLPLKFLNRKSRTAMVAPSTIDISHYQRSAQPPAYDCIR